VQAISADSSHAYSGLQYGLHTTSGGNFSPCSGMKRMSWVQPDIFVASSKNPFD